MRKRDEPTMLPLSSERIATLQQQMQRAPSLKALSRELGVSPTIITSALAGKPLQMAKRNRIEAALEKYR